MIVSSIYIKCMVESLQSNVNTHIYIYRKMMEDAKIDGWFHWEE